MVYSGSSSPKRLFQQSIEALIETLKGLETMRVPTLADIRSEEGELTGKGYNPQTVELYILQVKNEARAAIELAQQIGEENRDLHSARNPEVERLAAMIFASGPAHAQPEQAFARAEAFAAVKNGRRQG